MIHFRDAGLFNLGIFCEVRVLWMQLSERRFRDLPGVPTYVLYERVGLNLGRVLLKVSNSIYLVLWRRRLGKVKGMKCVCLCVWVLGAEGL